MCIWKHSDGWGIFHILSICLALQRHIKKTRERVWQYMGKLCYNEGLPECRKCSPKQAKMQFKDYCLQFFSSHVSTKPTLVSLWSTLRHWNWFCQHFYLLKPVLLSVLILLDLVVVLTWLFLPSFITGLPGHPPTFLWLVLSTGYCVSTSIIDSTLPFWPLNAEGTSLQSTDVHSVPLLNSLIALYTILSLSTSIQSIYSKGDLSSILGLGRFFGEGNGNPFQDSGESHGQRSLAGYSSWGHLKLGMTKHLTHTHTCIPSPSLVPELIHPVQHLKLCSLCALKNVFLPLSSPFPFLSFLTFSCFGK